MPHLRPLIWQVIHGDDVLVKDVEVRIDVGLSGRLESRIGRLSPRRVLLRLEDELFDVVCELDVLSVIGHRQMGLQLRLNRMENPRCFDVVRSLRHVQVSLLDGSIVASDMEGASASRADRQCRRLRRWNRLFPLVVGALIGALDADDAIERLDGEGVTALELERQAIKVAADGLAGDVLQSAHANKVDDLALAEERHRTLEADGRTVLAAQSRALMTARTLLGAALVARKARAGLAMTILLISAGQHRRICFRSLTIPHSAGQRPRCSHCHWQGDLPGRSTGISSRSRHLAALALTNLGRV